MCKFHNSKGIEYCDICRETFHSFKEPGFVCQVSFVYIIVTNHINNKNKGKMCCRAGYKQKSQIFFFFFFFFFFSLDRSMSISVVKNNFFFFFFFHVFSRNHRIRRCNLSGDPDLPFRQRCVILIPNLHNRATAAPMGAASTEPPTLRTVYI